MGGSVVAGVLIFRMCGRGVVWIRGKLGPGPWVGMGGYELCSSRTMVQVAGVILLYGRCIANSNLRGRFVMCVYI
jgi:hypothetical protein